MRRATTEDTDIRIDKDGQPCADEKGEFLLVSGTDCFLQDIWLDMLTEEGELLQEDAEGEAAFGYGLRRYMNAEFSEEIQEEISALIRNKLTKRQDIRNESIKITVTQRQNAWSAHVQFQIGTDDNINIQIGTDGNEVYVT